MSDYAKEIIAHLKKCKLKYQELSQLLEAPEVLADQKYSRHIIKQRNLVFEAAEIYDKINDRLKALEYFEAESGHFDDEIEALKEETEALRCEIDELVKEGAALIACENENAASSAILELRTKDGGDFGAFLITLLNMYQNYAREGYYNIEINDIIYTDKEKAKLAMLTFYGDGVYGRLVNESGIHTALGLSKKAEVEVYVYPKSGQICLDLDDNDIRIDIFHSGGPGGQNVNKVASAVRLTHIPTGIAVACQEERSQLNNKQRAYDLLKERLYAYYKKIKDEDEASLKKSLLKNLKRIRSYDFKSNTVIDKRIDASFSLSEILKGELDSLIDVLVLNMRGNGCPK